MYYITETETDRIAHDFLNVTQIFGNVASLHVHPEIFRKIPDMRTQQEQQRNRDSNDTGIIGRFYGVEVIIDPTIYPYYFEKEIGPSGR